MNSEKRKEYRKTFYQRHKEEIKARVLTWSKEFAERDPKGFWAYRILVHAKNRAKRKGLSFSLSEKDLTCPDKCPVFGMPLAYARYSGNAKKAHDSPSLDRIDSTKGYEPGNVWVISWRANWLKNNASLEELEKLVEALKRKDYEK